MLSKPGPLLRSLVGVSGILASFLAEYSLWIFQAHLRSGRVIPSDLLSLESHETQKKNQETEQNNKRVVLISGVAIRMVVPHQHWEGDR